MKFSNKYLLAMLVFPFLAIVSCNTGNNNVAVDNENYSYQDVKSPKDMKDMNRELIDMQDEMIKSYITRRKWDMQQTKTGLYYQIYHTSPSGVMPVVGKKAEFAYKTYLLDGTLIYSSDSTGNREMLIGHNTEETGIDEGLRMLHVGDKARFILHPHLAYGVPGDGHKVPYRAILVYDIELINVND
ncbi:MAG: FKBP-type peptidyl-prolyl cis-trans isomerase [Bacteroidales bacterium]|nr:FKBP-type peptidyl-prolyl cis-trans isomerase [Bacteroidales bacterium]HOY40098.1 FKBP-type peptidyl-prolyl cis-trans isomerase [Bacteroidales bacterium]HQP03960.1 FKBP-type peptidyl-prolyl cis-trans isomerase [Bacteroidales bacterium]